MSNHQGRRHRQAPSPFLLMMFAEIYNQLERLPSKPPVTIMLLFANIFVHLSPYATVLGYDLTDIHGNCLHPEKIVSSFLHYKKLLFNRMIFSSVIHGDDLHLYYNMISLCWKGIHLETSVGSSKFLQLVAFSVVMCPILMILVAGALDSFVGLDAHLSGYHSCAVGFSGVLFSLKYVWNQTSNEGSNVLGFHFSAKWAAWAELFYISLITPNASFVGHLSGILAGMLYLHGSRWIAASPSGQFFSSLLSGQPSASSVPGGGGSSSSGGTRYTYQSGALGGASSGSSNYSSTFRNRRTGPEFELETDEGVAAAERSHLSAEELRNRRASRFI